MGAILRTHLISGSSISEPRFRKITSDDGAWEFDNRTFEFENGIDFH